MFDRHNGTFMVTPEKCCRPHPFYSGKEKKRKEKRNKASRGEIFLQQTKN